MTFLSWSPPPLGLYFTEPEGTFSASIVAAPGSFAKGVDAGDGMKPTVARGARGIDGAVAGEERKAVREVT